MRNRKKKLTVLLLVFGMLFCVACGSEEDETGAVMEGSIEVATELPDRDIRIPDYMGENEEGAGEEEPVYHLSGEEQTEKARQVAAQIEDSINQVLADKDFYPNVTAISVNPECTEFNVTFSSRELSLYENVLHMSLCIVGNRFQLYQGKQESDLMTVVNYIDESSGEIFNTINSQEIE